MRRQLNVTGLEFEFPFTVLPVRLGSTLASQKSVGLYILSFFYFGYFTLILQIVLQHMRGTLHGQGVGVLQSFQVKMTVKMAKYSSKSRVQPLFQGVRPHSELQGPPLVGNRRGERIYDSQKGIFSLFTPGKKGLKYLKGLLSIHGYTYYFLLNQAGCT